MSEIKEKKRKKDDIYKRSYLGSLYILFTLFILFICRSSLTSKPVSDFSSSGIEFEKHISADTLSVRPDSFSVKTTETKPEKRSQKNKIKELTVSKKLVNINTASAEELAGLKGIGKKIAGEIVKFRNENGPFNTAEDIMKVKGIGDSKYSKIRDFIILK
ncbi:MAG TPA: helix-hairpin-helix domain-containing protein [Clostridiales bacterium]|nr:helix-hairpin-helix domain-containing protein [Clostridiales bacterium]HQP68941.1 helix-hairpin-helix domain-containing protein [Clostridiales bacterium]